MDHGSGSSRASHTPGTSISSLPMAGGNASMYPPGAITESPKPLSPGMQGHDAAGANAQHFARHQGDRQTPPGLFSSVMTIFGIFTKATQCPISRRRWFSTLLRTLVLPVRSQPQAMRDPEGLRPRHPTMLVRTAAATAPTTTSLQPITASGYTSRVSKSSSSN